MNNDMPADNAKNPHNLEDAMLVISVKSWIAVASIVALLAATVTWAFFGTMYLNEDVSGVLVRSGKVVTIYSPENSVILDLAIQPGQYVEKNQVLARFNQPELVSGVNMMLAENVPDAEIAVARKELLERSRVVTEDAGRILDVFVHNGDYVEKGMRLASISTGTQRTQSLECLLYLPIGQVHGIRKGMQVNVYPDFADKNEFGNMTGTVAYISEYPVTRQYLYDTLGNAELAETFMGDTACYEVSVNLVTSEETRTGYKWTTSSGPQKEIGHLSLCSATIVTDELRPIDVFFLNK